LEKGSLQRELLTDARFEIDNNQNDVKKTFAYITHFANECFDVMGKLS